MYYVSNRARSAGKLCAKKGARLVRSYAIFFSSRISFLCGATTLRKHSFSTTASRQHTSYFFLQFSYYPTYLLQYREKWKRFQSLQTFQICSIIGIYIGFARTEKDLMIWNISKIMIVKLIWKTDLICLHIYSVTNGRFFKNFVTFSENLNFTLPFDHIQMTYDRWKV